MSASPPRVRIRRYRPGDAGDFIALVRALARYEKLKPPPPAAARRLVRDIGRRIEVLLAELAGRPAGYAIYLWTYSSFLARPTLFLEDIFLLPEARGAGVGLALWKTIEREARRCRAGRIEFIVLDWNRPAHRFYRKVGAHPLDDWRFYRKSLRS